MEKSPLKGPLDSEEAKIDFEFISLLVRDVSNKRQRDVSHKPQQDVCIVTNKKHGYKNQRQQVPMLRNLGPLPHLQHETIQTPPPIYPSAISEN